MAKLRQNMQTPDTREREMSNALDKVLKVPHIPGKLATRPPNKPTTKRS